MNIIFLKLYITGEVNNAFYNSQEMGLAKALVKKHPEHHVDIVMLSGTVSERQDSQNDGGSAQERAGDGKGAAISVHVLPAKGFGHHGMIDLGILKELKADLVHLLADNMLYAPQVIDYCLKNNIKCHLYIGTLFTDSSNGLKQAASKVMMRRNLAADVVRAVGPLTFGVYLLHMHEEIKDRWVEWLEHLLGDIPHYSIPLFAWHALLSILIVFVAGVFVDWIRKMIFEYVERVLHDTWLFKKVRELDEKLC